MAYTSVIQAAQADMRCALADGRKPIIHIRTDSFDDVLQICNHAFFGLEDGEQDCEIYSPNAENGRYIYLNELIEDEKRKGDWRLAAPELKVTPYVFGKYILLYHPADDGNFDSDVLQALTSYVNIKRAAQSQSPGNRDGEWPKSIVVLYGSYIKIPGDLDESVDFIEVGRMTREDISLVLNKHLAAHGKAEEYDEIREDAKLIEFYHQQFSPNSEAFMLDMLDKIAYGPEWMHLLRDIKRAEMIIREHKINLLKSHNLLEWIPFDDELLLDQDSYEYQWTQKRKALIVWETKDSSDETDVPRIKGEPTIKGMLLLGGPGTGKSRSAKGVAQLLGMPLFRMAMDRILDSLVGNSDKNLRQALKDLASVGRVTLWIDEIEKALGGGSRGAGGGEKDGDGLMDRLNGQLLTFQQETKQPVFIIATANSVENLLPEMFRNGRYDVRIAKMMPNYDECCAIMHSMLKSKLGIADHELAKYFVDISSIKNSHGEDRPLPQFLTGADIEALIKALRAHLNLPKDTHYVLKDASGLRTEDKAIIRKAMRSASEDVTATVDAASPNTVDRIAASYVATFGESTILGGSKPAIDKAYYDRDAVLFSDEPVMGKSDFTRQRKANDKGKAKKVSCIVYPESKSNEMKEYDWKMYCYITAAMNRYLLKQR